MTTRYAHKDGYTYDDSPVLKNLAGHRTQEDLDKFERISVAIRMMEAPPDGDFDYPHLKRIHHHLFQDVYDWAGDERNVSISKGSTQFCNPRFIASFVTGLLSELAEENHLRAIPAEDFVDRAAHYMLELNMAHPFREGNGRACRYFLFLLAQNAGYGLDGERLENGWLDASIKGVAGDKSPMRDLIAQAIILYED